MDVCVWYLSVECLYYIMWIWCGASVLVVHVIEWYNQCSVYIVVAYRCICDTSVLIIHAYSMWICVWYLISLSLHQPPWVVCADLMR